MKYHDDNFNYDVVAPIVFGFAILILLFAIIISSKPTSSRKVEKKVPTQEELKKIDQEKNFAFIDGVPYYYSK